MNTFQILKPADWPLFKEIRLDALKNAPSSFGSKYENALLEEDSYWIENVKNADNTFFVALEGNTPLALLRLTLNDHEVPANYAYLGSLYVKEEHRQQGIAKALMQMAENHAKEIPNLKGIYLEVYASLTNAVKLYESLGYRVEKERISDGHRDLLMVKDLAIQPT